MKKKVLLLLVIACLFSLSKNVKAATKCGTTITGSEYKICDVNQDDEINVDDVVTVLKADTEQLTFTSEQTLLGDANGDGAINSGDAGNIFNYIKELAPPIDYEGLTCKKIYYDECRLGDINCDGHLDTDDAKIILNYNVNNLDEELTANQLKLANVNSDNEINTGDASVILSYVKYAYEYLPKECSANITNPKTGDSMIITIVSLAIISLALVIIQTKKKVLN